MSQSGGQAYSSVVKCLLGKHVVVSLIPGQTKKGEKKKKGSENNPTKLFGFYTLISQGQRGQATARMAALERPAAPAQDAQLCLPWMGPPRFLVSTQQSCPQLEHTLRACPAHIRVPVLGQGAHPTHAAGKKLELLTSARIRRAESRGPSQSPGSLGGLQSGPATGKGIGVELGIRRVV